MDLGSNRTLHDPLKPSLFELLSEQQLSSLLPATLRYLLTVATQRHPRYLLRILNSFDEIYAGLSLLVERHYLTTFGGSFTEHFYGLRRSRVPRTKSGELPRAQAGASDVVREILNLSRADVWKNLAVLVALPYIKRKLDESYEIYVPQATILGPNYNRDNLPPRPTISQRLKYYFKWFLRKIYPSLNAAYHLSMLFFSLGYLFDSLRYHSPFLWLIRTRMRRMGDADYKAIALAAMLPAKPKFRGQSGQFGRPRSSTSMLSPRIAASIIYPRLLGSLKILLPTSIFALKFLEWWHASDFANQLSRKATEGLELPPPIISAPPVSCLIPSNSPSLSEKHQKAPFLISHDEPPISSSSMLPIYTVLPVTSANSSLCPICLQAVTTATACQTGYVFCYACIYRWVDGSHDRQISFMEGAGGEEGWGEEQEGGKSRAEKWESGKGRCAVTGRRVLGGVDGLRRVMA